MAAEQAAITGADRGEESAPVQHRLSESAAVEIAAGSVTTAGELIERLMKIPPATPLLLEGYESGFTEVSDVCLVEVQELEGLPEYSGRYLLLHDAEAQIGERLATNITGASPPALVGDPFHAVILHRQPPTELKERETAAMISWNRNDDNDWSGVSDASDMIYLARRADGRPESHWFLSAMKAGSLPVCVGGYPQREEALHCADQIDEGRHATVRLDPHSSSGVVVSGRS